MTEQAVHSGGPAGGAVPHPGAEPFLGRGRELAQLRRDIGRAGLDTMAGRPAPRARVLLVAGRPGSGRSALAEEFVRELLATGAYPDGVLRARLTGPGGVPVPAERVARDLLNGLPGLPGGLRTLPGAGEEDLAEALRDALAERRALLLLDDADSAGQLADLVPDNRRCLVIAVGRGPLTGVSDVRPCTLGGLERSAAVGLLIRGAGPTRVTVDPTAAEALAEECAHQPAALVLAAGWLAVHPEAAVADAVRCIREAGGNGNANGGGPASPVRGPGEGEGEGDGEAEGTGHAAEAGDGAGGPVARAFRLVHDSLSPSAARLLRLLGLAPDGLADAHIAASLAGCSVESARSRLEDFALLGLVRYGGTAGREALYRVPGCLDGLLRGLLRSRERPGEVTLARARMLERMVRQLRVCQAVTEAPGSPARVWLSAQPGTLRFPDHSSASHWLEARLSGLLSAVRLAVADGELDTLARRLVAALSGALLGHRGPAGAAPELYRLQELLLAVAERQELPRERAAALLYLGDADTSAGRLPAALDRYRTALEAAREGEQPHSSAAGRAVESLAGTHAGLGDWPRASDWYERALAISQSRGDLDAEARLHGCLGDTLARAQRWEEALRSWRAAAAAHRRRGDGRSHARALAEAARVQGHAGRHEEALRTCRDALRHAERAGDERLQAALRLRSADSAERLGDHAAAADHRAGAERLLARSQPAARPRSRDARDTARPAETPAAPGEAPESSATTEGESCERESMSPR